MDFAHVGEDFRITTVPCSGSTPGLNGSPLSFDPLTFARGKEYSLLLAGRSDGNVSSWKVTEKVNTGGAPKENVLSSREPHLGHISAMEYFESSTFTGGRVLVTSSFDRTCKLWDPWVDVTADPHLQTLVGHGATVTAITDTGLPE